MPCHVATVGIHRALHEVDAVNGSWFMAFKSATSPFERASHPMETVDLLQALSNGWVEISRLSVRGKSLQGASCSQVTGSDPHDVISVLASEYSK